MTPRATVKVIKGTGPGLSNAQLEDASMRLLVARIRGDEPQISFTFVQRLLDELILRRHDDIRIEKEAAAAAAAADTAPFFVEPGSGAWLDGSDDLVEVDEIEVDEIGSIEEEWDPASSFDLETLEYEDLHAAAVEGIESRNPAPAQTPQRVVVCSRPKRSFWEGAVNPWRVLVISLLVAFLMAAGVFLTGCNHHDRSKADPPHAVDAVDGLHIAYKSLDQESVELEPARRGRILSAVAATLAVFKQDHGSLPGVWVCDVFVGPTVAENPSYVPCGIPNGGGCYTYASRQMMVIAGECDNVPYLYHELNHARLEEAGVSRLLNNSHTHESWQLVRNRTAELRDRCD